jgi:hypothetical protein
VREPVHGLDLEHFGMREPVHGPDLEHFGMWEPVHGAETEQNGMCGPDHSHFLEQIASSAHIHRTVLKPNLSAFDRKPAKMNVFEVERPCFPGQVAILDHPPNLLRPLAA